MNHRQHVAQIQKRLAACETDAECSAIEAELEELVEILSNPGQPVEVIAVLHMPGVGAQYLPVETRRVTEHFIVHPSVRTEQEVVGAASGSPTSWGVTHVPTGQLVATVALSSWAQLLAYELEKLGGDDLDSANVIVVQQALGGRDMLGAAYVAHVQESSKAPSGRRGAFPQYRVWSRKVTDFNPADADERKSKAAIGAALGAIVGGVAGVVAGMAGGGLLGLLVGGVLAGGQGAVGGGIVGAVMGAPVGYVIGTIWGAVHQTDKALGGVDSRTAKLGAGVGAIVLPPPFNLLGAAGGAYLGA